ncbi:LIM/homeobox protein Awh isoform X2 [Eurytemora carolleeae]|uniref:LIM/homeobox protein Awh isoform X2 n=1 Tax=Eurytemora carolleeae TaxID=1294199 RepID=UPI000C771C99|nr:LIM/homeobox protein Awh isoform X2 [Eurytemora carolleeae]|eukprot:XP_023349154.1 LIM/homeobox protein Awh-like isoform X2 [Eurytemora affinis]
MIVEELITAKTEPEIDFIKPEIDFKDNYITCNGCGYGIHEEFILKVGDKSWHSSCLRCSVCDVLLNYENSCFIRDDKILCRQDYTKIFGTRCSKCCHLITQNDWIRRAGEQVFHLACFACDSCTRQLSTGEEFGLVESRVLCKSHYLEIIEGGSGSSTDGDCCDTEANSKKRKSKRNRTTFTDEQIHILQANFQIDCNPDGQDLERIADISGLSKRVVQVWFQNARARNKKYISKNRSLGPGTTLCGPDQIDVNIAFSAFYSGSPENEIETSGPCFTPPTQV